MNKSQIRKKILKIRKQVIFNNLSINFKHIFSILNKKNIKGKIVGGYYPFNYEIDILEILKKFEKKNYQISLPKINKKSKMDFFSWSSSEPLEINEYGIPEPISSEKKFPNILLVPLVAYDDNLNRLGYGSGFYDRYINKIEKYKKIIKIWLAFSYQRLKKIPTAEYDKKLDFIMTEKGILEWKYYF